MWIPLEAHIHPPVEACLDHFMFWVCNAIVAACLDHSFQWLFTPVSAWEWLWEMATVTVPPH